MQWAQGWAAYANMYAALLIMAFLCSGLITLLFRLRDRLLAWQRGLVRWVAVPTPTESADPENGDLARGTTLTIHDLSHHFQLHGQPLRVLDRISFRVGRGEFVALLGPSGCGKSTLLRLVAGLDFPSTGSLLTDDKPVEGPNPSRIVVFQDPTLYPWRTVWGNVALGPEARGLLHTHRERIKDALRLVGLDA